MQEEKNNREAEREEPEENGAVDEEEQPEPEEPELSEEEEEDVFPEELPSRRGCLRGCLFPIIGLLLLIVVAVMILYSKQEALSRMLLKRIINNTQRHVLDDLPEDMDEEVIRAKFEEVKAALKADQVNKESLTKAIEEYQKSGSSNQRDQVIQNLMKGLDEAIPIRKEP